MKEIQISNWEVVYNCFMISKSTFIQNFVQKLMIKNSRTIKDTSKFSLSNLVCSSSDYVSSTKSLDKPKFANPRSEVLSKEFRFLFESVR